MAINGVNNSTASFQNGENAAKVQVGTNSIMRTSITSTTNQQNIGKIGILNEDGQKHDPELEAIRIKNAINQVNEKLKLTQTRCEYSYIKEVNRVSIKVLDKETDEVIREIPPEETLKALEKIWKIAGLLVDERR